MGGASKASLPINQLHIRRTRRTRSPCTSSQPTSSRSISSLHISLHTNLDMPSSPTNNRCMPSLTVSSNTVVNKGVVERAWQLLQELEDWLLDFWRRRSWMTSFEPKLYVTSELESKHECTGLAY